MVMVMDGVGSRLLWCPKCPFGELLSGMVIQVGPPSTAITSSCRQAWVSGENTWTENLNVSADYPVAHPK